MIRLGLRARLQLAVGVAVLLALIGLVAGFNLILGRALERNARDLARSRAVAVVDSLRTSGGHLSVGETLNDRDTGGYIWVFTGTRALEQPRAPQGTQRAARALAGGTARFLDVGNSDTRLYAAPVTGGGRRIGTVVASVSLAPYEQTRRLALLASFVLGGMILLLVMVAARWLVGASLRQVLRMTRQAAAWSEHDLDHRFALGPPDDELTELASTLDGLLDRLAASLRHERRFSAELSHELRTPLARVLAEAELALRRQRTHDEYRDSLELIRRNADQLARTIDTLVAVARHEAGAERGTADANAVAESAAHACGPLSSGRGLDVAVARPMRALRLGVDADLAQRIIQPVFENACRYGATSVRVAIRQESSGVVYSIEDDGPGVTAGERERIFEPGVRGSAATGREGAGLGLALARRLARAIDGEVVADPAAPGGRFLITLPAA